MNDVYNDTSRIVVVDDIMFVGENEIAVSGKNESGEPVGETFVFESGEKVVE
jgi:hypothetical protein